MNIMRQLLEEDLQSQIDLLEQYKREYRAATDARALCAGIPEYDRMIIARDLREHISNVSKSIEIIREKIAEEV